MNPQENDESSVDVCVTYNKKYNVSETCIPHYDTNLNSVCNGTKSTFEEVEIKLEKMFAGIEDERCLNSNIKTTTLKSDFLPAILPEKIFQTKAAVKSTDCIHNQKHYKYGMESESITLDKEKALIINTEVNRSISGNHGNTKQIDEIDCRKKLTKTTIVNNDTKRSKSLKNSQKFVNDCFSSSKFKKKKGNLKRSHQKFKRIGNNSSSSDGNETDEKNIQPREMDTKYRSPYVFIKSGGQITIVNTTSADDNNDKIVKLKKGHERKNVKGTYSSTLSNKYDADTPDSSWICVFCKRGPHKKGLGDLFGPYVASIDIVKYTNGTHVQIGSSEVMRNHNVGEVIPTYTNEITKSTTKSTISQGTECESHDHQTSQDRGSIYGEHKLPICNGIHNKSQNIEIWFHEDCAVWAPNLFLVGSKLVGLDSAIWNGTKHICIYCGRTGAIVCCLERECKATAHPICARDSQWLLNESKLWAYCGKHY